MTIAVDVQYATHHPELPTEAQLTGWVTKALQAAQQGSGEITIRLTSATEVQHLNLTYRGTDRPTNVLSFPATADVPLTVPLLGDLVLSVETVVAEAAEQNKDLMHHFTHLVVHGVLHLLGYDHMQAAEARVMEELEVSILAGLGIADPYHIEHNAGEQGDKQPHA